MTSEKTLDELNVFTTAGMRAFLAKELNVDVDLSDKDFGRLCRKTLKSKDLSAKLVKRLQTDCSACGSTRGITFYIKYVSLDAKCWNAAKRFVNLLYLAQTACESVFGTSKTIFSAIEIYVALLLLLLPETKRYNPVEFCKETLASIFDQKTEKYVKLPALIMAFRDGEKLDDDNVINRLNGLGIPNPLTNLKETLMVHCFVLYAKIEKATDDVFDYRSGWLTVQGDKNCKLGPMITLPHSLRTQIQQGGGLKCLQFKHDISMKELNSVLAVYLVNVAKHAKNRLKIDGVLETQASLDERAELIREMLIHGGKSFDIFLFYESADLELGSIEFLFMITSYDVTVNKKKIAVLEYACSPPKLGKRSASKVLECWMSAYIACHAFVIQSVGTLSILETWGNMPSFHDLYSSVSHALFYGWDSDPMIKLAEKAGGLHHGTGLFIKINTEHKDYVAWKENNNIPDLRRAANEACRVQVLRDMAVCTPMSNARASFNVREQPQTFPSLYTKERFVYDLDGYYSFPDLGRVVFKSCAGRFAGGIIHSLAASDCPVDADGKYVSTACLYSALVYFDGDKGDKKIIFRVTDNGLEFTADSHFANQTAIFLGKEDSAERVPVKKTSKKSEVKRQPLKRNAYPKLGKPGPKRLKKLRKMKSTSNMRKSKHSPRSGTNQKNHQSKGVVLTDRSVSTAATPSLGQFEHDPATTSRNSGKTRKRSWESNNTSKRRKRE